MSTPPHVRDFVLDRGWWMGHIGPIQAIYIGTSLTAESFAAHVAAAAAEIDARTDADRFAGLFVMPDARAMRPTYRKDIANVLAARREKLKRTTPAFVMITESLLVRSLMQTVQFFAPPPYPHAVEKDVPRGLAFLAKHLPHLDTGRWHAQWLEVHRAALPLLGERSRARDFGHV